MLCNYAPAVTGFRGPLIRELVRRDAVVFVLAPDYTKSTKEQVVALGAVPVDCRMDRTGANPVRELLTIVRLQRLLRSLRVDLCLGFMTKLVIYGSIAAFFAGVPHRCSMVEGLGYFFTDDGESRPGVRKLLIRHVITLLYRVCLPLNRTVFFLNPDDERELAPGTSGAGTSAVILNGIGIDTLEYSIAPLNSERVTFLLVGRLLKEKGVREYIRAAERVKQAYPRARFVLVGGLDSNPGGIGEDEVRDWVARGVVEWPGAVPDAKPWLASATVYVLPSYREGMPRTVLEAMAMGRPLITTDAPGCRETIARYNPDAERGHTGRNGIIEGRNGFLVPARDADALAAAMERFLAEPELTPRMGAASRELAERKFDVGKVNAVILAALGL